MSEATKVFFALCRLQTDKIDARSNTVPFTVSGNSGRFTYRVMVSRSSQTSQDEECIKLGLASSRSETTPTQRPPPPT